MNQDACYERPDSHEADTNVIFQRGAGHRTLLGRISREWEETTIKAATSTAKHIENSAFWYGNKYVSKSENRERN